MQIEIERGHFYETGLGYAINRLNPWILAPDKYGEGLKRLKQVVHSGGHTTIGDLYRPLQLRLRGRSIIEPSRR